MAPWELDRWTMKHHFASNPVYLAIKVNMETKRTIGHRVLWNCTWDRCWIWKRVAILGKKGVASVVKNPRGPPRLLCSVVFDDESNVYETGIDDNLTTIPEVGQELFVLGPNEDIPAGTITSIAEPSATGDATIVGLALVRR